MIAPLHVHIKKDKQETMNKKIIITALLAFIAMAGQAQIHYRIEGHIGKPDFTGMMEIIDLMKWHRVDTIEVVNGIITPKEGDLPEMILCVLEDTTHVLVQTDSVPYTQSKLSLHWLYIDNGTTRVEGLKDNWLQQSGTPISDEIAAFNQRMGEVQYSKTATAELLYDVISRHSRDVYGAILLNNEGRLYLKPDKWIELYNILMRDNGEYISKTRLARDLKRTKTKFEQQPATDVGNKFVDFAVEYNGTSTRLSDYVGHGQYVLADFWASWCGPCRAEIPNIIAVYNKYKDKGLQVLGIAAWDKPEDTLKAIEEEKIPYPQILNTQKIATDLYGINGIPEIILFAPDGTILSRGLRGDKIEKKLAEIFKEL